MNWINKMKSFFERKSNNTHENNKPGSSDVSGIVKQRMKFYEDLQTANSEPTTSGRKKKRIARKDTTIDNLRRSKVSYDVYQTYSKKSNTELTPAMVVNSDNICIYNADDDAVYGSFKKRPRFVNKDCSNENEVIMRLKVRENEHLGISRYKSILKVPLSQQLILSKYNEAPTVPTDPDSSKDVKSIIDELNQQCLTKKKKEQVFDIDLLNSICKNDRPGSALKTQNSIRQYRVANRQLKWVDTVRVKSPNLLQKLTPEEIHFQECQFELITSEASYYHSLNVLVDKFYNSPLLEVNNKDTSGDKSSNIKAHQKEHLFSNILQIHSTSGKFLSDLEKRFSESVVMKDLCDIVTRYSKNQFKVYVPYLQNQKFQTEAYNELKKNESTAKIIDELESQPECCSLSLDSFLLLPMQRLLRIQLLVKAIKKNVPKGNTLASTSSEIALLSIENIIDQCSTKKGQMDERQRMLEIVSSLTTKTGTTIPTISSGILIHEGEVKCHKSCAGTRSIRVYDAWIILTNEYFLITKVTRSKKTSYVVEDICPIKNIIFDESATGKENRDGQSQQFSVTFQDNITYIIQTKSRGDYSRWIKELAICPKKKVSNCQSK